MDLSREHNWCDKRCERCPLEQTCAVACRVAETTRRHMERGEDPDDWDVILRDIAEDFAKTIEMIEAVAREDGIDLSAPAPEPPPSLGARRLKEAGLRYVHSAAAIARVAPGEDADALSSSATMTAVKLARIGGALELPDESSWDYDVAPNRLLLERIDEDARRALESLAARFPGDPVESCDSIRREITALVERTFGRVPDGVRAAVEAMTAKGRAPSPFCVREAPQEGH
jgi:hypothetical protein